MTYDYQSSSFLECFPTILEYDWLTKRATARVTPAFTCPETSANRFSNTSMRRKSQFFLQNETFLFLNVRCEAKGNISDGIIGLVILLKGKYSFHFVHNTAARGLMVFELFFLKC